MPLKLMLITNDPNLAREADKAGVDRIWLDFETLGKYERQGHLDTHIADHHIGDIKKIKEVITQSQIISRVNPINDNSKEEIDKVVNYGSDIVMLPMYRGAEDAKRFIDLVAGRTGTCLLLETPQALVRLDDTLELEGIDEIHIGLNDLHLGMGLDFMFELLSGGIVEYLGNKIKNKKIMWGFGGIAQIGEGTLPADYILGEHVRLGSQMVILSRSFKDKSKDLVSEVGKIRQKIEEIEKWDTLQFEENRNNIRIAVNKIVAQIRENKQKTSNHGN